MAQTRRVMMSGDGNLIIPQASIAEPLNALPLFHFKYLKGRVAQKDRLKKLIVHFIEIKHLVKDSIEEPPMSQEYLRCIIASFYKMQYKGRPFIILIFSLNCSGAVLHLNKAC